MFWSIGATDPRGAADDFWYADIGAGAATSSGQRVSPERALTLPAVYSCIRVIADSLMQVPLIMYRRTGKNTKERATEHPLYNILHRAPNGLNTSPEWREIKQHHLLMRGNSYAPIQYQGSRISGLGEPIHPDLVTPERIKDTAGDITVQYRIRVDAGEAVFSNADILHIRGPGNSADGLRGLNPIELEREAIGSGLAAQDFTGRFFANDAQPSGVLKHPGNFKTDEQRNKFRDSFQKSVSGANWRKLALLEYGVEYAPIDVKLVDAQFLEQRKYSNLDACRIFRVPPHLIMELDRATFSNITQQDVEFVKFTMLPWFIRWETRLSMSLLTEDEQEEYFFEFLVDGLERGDSEARAKYYKAGIADGWMVPNEARAKENLSPPLEDGDEPRRPLNMERPGGDNDERINEDLKEGAARALARKQCQMFFAMGDSLSEAFIFDQWETVAEFMKCDNEAAKQYSKVTAGLLRVDLETKLDVDLWQERAFRLLMEIT